MIDKELLEKYAYLLVHYSLYLKRGERLFINSTVLATPLIEEVYKEAIKIGVIVEVNLKLRYQSDLLLEYGDANQLKHLPVLEAYCLNKFDAYLSIRAPFSPSNFGKVNDHNSRTRRETLKEINETYFRRIGNGSMKRSLCQFPTEYNAELAGMSLEEYTNFVFNACYLFEEDAGEAWRKLSSGQQLIADYLNTKELVRYKNDKTDIEFSLKGRKWINSDGKNNMPSGEVFSSPVEDSVNGYIYFDYPSVYKGRKVAGISLLVVNGEIVKWDAKTGKSVLDEVFEIEGTKFFGEVAIGNNFNIQRATNNILFDEKIGGTIHMAIGQSYIQTGGKNVSPVHWDLITDMKVNGEIYADGELIYKNGQFIVDFKTEIS